MGCRRLPDDIEQILERDRHAVKRAAPPPLIDFNFGGAASVYAKAFQAFGLDVQSGQTEALARRIRAGNIGVNTVAC